MASWPTNELYEALLEVSVTKIALWICVCADDWAPESTIKASNENILYKWDSEIHACKNLQSHSRVKINLTLKSLYHSPKRGSPHEMIAFDWMTESETGDFNSFLKS